MRHCPIVFPVLLAALAACGLGPGADPLDPDELATDTSGIVGGTRQPTVVSLTARQKLAVGAVLGGGDDAWDNFCTGTLVTPKLVVTAGHCVEGVRASELAFAIGGDAAGPIESASPTAIHLHPGYQPEGDARHDFAVLRFSTAFTRADPISPNCAALAAGLVGTRAEVAGYGETETDEYNTLQWWAPVKVTAVSSFDVTVNGGGRGGCYGDSGGPLLAMVAGAPSLRGTLSWGDTCGASDHYARLDDNCAFLATVPGFAAPTPSPATPPPPTGGAAVTVEGVGFSAAEATKVLALANTASTATLDDTVGLDSRAAKGIVARRPLASLEALGAVPYVGPVALARLRDHVGP